MPKGVVQSVVLGLAMFGWANFSIAQDVEEWWLYAEVNILPESVAPQNSYRLANRRTGKQLRHGQQSPGINLVWGSINANTGVSAGDKNIKIQRLVHDPNSGDTPNVGHNVRLNEPIAISIQGGGYLVYKKGDGIDLGWQEKARFNPVSNNPDVYQWEFRQERDHRNRDINTKEHLALFNTVAKAYLVFGEQPGIDLKWRR